MLHYATGGHAAHCYSVLGITMIRALEFGGDVSGVGREPISHSVTCSLPRIPNLLVLSWMVANIITTDEKLNKTDKVAIMVEEC